MIAKLLRGLLVAVTVLAFLGGTTVQAMPVLKANGVPAGIVKASVPCDHMAAMGQSGSAVPGHDAPCKGITPDCVKQMGCIGVPSLPARADVLITPVSYVTITYWSPRPTLGGVSPEPDLFPPIAG
ncbi:MAG TPA: hypothetical protein VJ779_16855 [Acetobacteraceae bacterium]|nr:hypothetical protein [Acetobacteraceae bacterium]